MSLTGKEAETMDALRSQDYLFTVVSRGVQSQARVCESVVNAVCFGEDPEAAMRAVTNARVRVLSLALGAEGACLGRDGALDDSHLDVAADLKGWQWGGESPGVAEPRTALGLACTILARRRERGFGALTLLNCDDMERNGTLLKRAVLAFASAVDRADGDVATAACVRMLWTAVLAKDALYSGPGGSIRPATVPRQEARQTSL